MTSLLETKHPYRVLVVLCLVLWLPGFFSLPPGDRDESRFVQASKQMLETGDFVRIQNGAEARNRKPIGIHWLQVPFAAAAQAAGMAQENPVWPYRIPSLLGGLAAVLATFALGERLLDRRAALLGAGMLAASVLLVVEVHIAKTDAALLGTTTVAMLLLGRAYVAPAGFSRRAAAGFWLAMGLGVLLKGPITPMVAGLATLWLVVTDRARPGGASWLRELRAGWGVPLMLLVVIPWFVAIGVATEGRFFSDAVGGDLGRKLTSGDESHWGPPGLHLLLTVLLVFPASAALPAGLVWLRRETGRARRFLLAWIVPAWIVFEAAPTKLPHYTLPLYPALCLVLAAGVCALPAAGPVAGSPVRRRIGRGFALLGCALLTGAAVAAPMVLHLSPARAWLLAVPAAIAVPCLGLFATRATRPERVWAAVLAAPLLYWTVLGWELPRLTPLWISPRVAAALHPADKVAAVGYAEPSLMVLGGTGIQFLRTEEAVQALADGTVNTLVVGNRDLAAVQAQAAAQAIPLRTDASVEGFNYSRGRAVTLSVMRRGS
jgi:hypothetical protein